MLRMATSLIKKEQIKTCEGGERYLKDLMLFRFSRVMDLFVNPIPFAA